MSFVAWIDFDQADRDRTRRIMDLFDSEESRDELGLGSVRDALADLMFPGTSTIQTRLRYMLFVPWIYRMAGAHPGKSDVRRERARALEIRLIDALIRGGETRGVIGSSAREKLKRLPSDVYWAGLMNLGIRRFHGSRSACLEAGTGEVSRLWAAGLPTPPDGFLETPDSSVRFNLTADEAGFLRDRLSNTAPDSLFTLLSRDENVPECQMIWLHPDRASWPASTRALVLHAELFSELMHGAALLYNLMLSEHAASMQGADDSDWHSRVTDYAARLDDWALRTERARLSGWDLFDLWRVTRKTTHDVKPHTCRFVEEWRAAVLRTGADLRTDAAARALVGDREIQLKRHKSRFRNNGALMRWSGASGTAPMNYRWNPVVLDHLRDLHDAG